VLHARCYATEEALLPPKPKAAGSPKITQIADTIASLTLLETAELVGVLKVRPTSLSFFVCVY